MNSSIGQTKPIKIMPVDETPREAMGKEEWVSLFKADDKIVPRSVWGRFAKVRWLFVWLTQLVFYGAPWLQYNGRQAVLFDLEAHRFFIGPLVLYPQDFIYLTALLVISALSLFLFTAVAGRLWCGYACPQTVYTEIFLWVERRIEGDRAARLRRAKGSWGIDRSSRAIAKHVVWASIGLYTGFTFVGYFTPIETLGQAIVAGSLSGWETFWVGFYGLATYGNAGWMREQVCKYMCPYARFQSAMFDKDTLLVTYDEHRGEPRGIRGKKAGARSANLGSCVDCGLCVQVCPTGIDIRRGLQYECIGCAACVDVCDSVMEKVGAARGLVRYSTQNGMAQGWTTAQMLRRLMRPRILIYTGVVWLLIASLGLALFTRPDLRVDVVRDRNVQYRLVEDGRIENIYRVQLMNATEWPLRVTASLPQLQGNVRGATFSEKSEWTLNSTEAQWVVVQVQASEELLEPGSNRIVMQFESVTLKNGKPEETSRQRQLEPAVLIAPF